MRSSNEQRSSSKSNRSQATSHKESAPHKPIHNTQANPPTSQTEEGYFTVLDYHTSHKGKPGSDKIRFEGSSGEDSAPDEAITLLTQLMDIGEQPSDLPATPQSADSSLTQSGLLQISAITKLINTASVNADSADLADLIMKMSQSKSSKRKNTKEAKPTDKKDVESSSCKKSDGSTTIGTRTRQDVDASSRCPADGKPTRRSVGSTKTHSATARASTGERSSTGDRPSIGQRSSTGKRISAGDRPATQSKAKPTDYMSNGRPQSMYSSSVPSSSKKGSKSLSTSSLPPAGAGQTNRRSTNRSRLPSREKSSERDPLNRSRIPSLERGKDGNKPRLDNSRGRTSGAKRNNSGGKNELSATTAGLDSDGTRSKIPLFHQRKNSAENNVPVPKTTPNGGRNSQSSVKEINDRTPSPHKVSSDNGFVAMEKDNSGTSGRPSSTTSPGFGKGSPGWRSPRPSSIMSRSQRFDATQMGHFPSNLDVNKADGSKAVAWDDRPTLGSSPTDGRLSLDMQKHQPTAKQDLLGSIKSLDGQYTPKEAIPSRPPSNATKSRMSSTPKAPMPKFSICDSQDSLSHISPMDQFVPDSADATLWSEKVGGSDEHMKKHPRHPAYYAVQQSTPKAAVTNVPYFESRPLSSPSENQAGIGSDGKQQITPTGPPPSVHQPHSGLLAGNRPQTPGVASSASSKPTLLTSQPLSTTAFAQHYLGSAKDYSIPSSNLQNMMAQEHQQVYKSVTVSTEHNLHQDLTAGHTRQVPDANHLASEICLEDARSK